jgi:hypothetical protein
VFRIELHFSSNISLLWAVKNKYFDFSSRKRSGLSKMVFLFLSDLSLKSYLKWIFNHHPFVYHVGWILVMMFSMWCDKKIIFPLIQCFEAKNFEKLWDEKFKTKLTSNYIFLRQITKFDKNLPFLDVIWLKLGFKIEVFCWKFTFSWSL